MATRTPRGYTLIELIVVLAMLALLATAVLPVAEITAQRSREQELKRALWEIRDAIDAYKKAVDAGTIAAVAGGTGYPASLAELVDGAPARGDPDAARPVPAARAARPFRFRVASGGTHVGAAVVCVCARQPGARRRCLRRAFAVVPHRAQWRGTAGVVKMRPAAPIVRAAGFTVVELLVVLAAVGLLLSVVAPRYIEHVDRAREAALRSNLAHMRTAIDQFLADRGRHPVDLNELVRERYLRHVPLDPITDRQDTWRLLPVDGAPRALADVRSGAPGAGKDGIPYASW